MGVEMTEREKIETEMKIEAILEILEKIRIQQT